MGGGWGEVMAKGSAIKLTDKWELRTSNHLKSRDSSQDGHQVLVGPFYLSVAYSEVTGLKRIGMCNVRKQGHRGFLT